VKSDDRPTIDVVVPVYGKWELTERCLATLAVQTVPHRVIVVDDAGPDDTVRRLRDGYPDVTVVPLDRNLGFAGACNRGIAAGTGSIVVLVNNDVEAEADLLERLVEPMVREPAVGSTSPLLLKPDGRVDAFGICADVTMAGFVRYNGATPAEATADASAPRLLGPYGAVAAYRRSALLQVGAFDEGITMYGEELDLALRLSADGWSTIAVGAARGVHLGGATSGRGSAQQRHRAGFGRGYLLRAYGVMRSRHAPRALITETIVCAGDLLLSRDLASAKGRLAGWRAGRGAESRPRAIPGVDRRIGFVASLRLRVGDRRA
jgi:GT2 family glycosyltransferase